MGPNVGMDPTWEWTQCGYRTQHRYGTQRGHGPHLEMNPVWVQDPTWIQDPAQAWTQHRYGPNVGMDPMWRQDPTWARDPTQLWPLTVSVAPQGPQQELRFGAGAVGVSHHHLRDGQVVHEGQQTLVRPPADATCVSAGAAPHHPSDPPSPCPQPPALTTACGRRRSCRSTGGRRSSCPARRRSAGCPAVSPPSSSAARCFGPSRS